MLLGQDGADEADDRGAVGEDADDVGAAADLAVEAFVGVVRPDLAPDLLGERGEGEDVVAGAVEVVGNRGELLGSGRRRRGRTGRGPHRRRAGRRSSAAAP